MMLQQRTFLDICSSEPINYTGLIRTLHFDQRKILRGIISLYNNGWPFDLDVTYSKGRFYNGVPEPRYKFDLFPQTPGTVQADARVLPLASRSMSSIIFDPPFIIKNVKTRELTGIIEKRFSGYPTCAALWNFYRNALSEFWRVLKPGGIVVFKCQDTVSGGKQHWSHIEIMKYADIVGYRCKDLFVLGRSGVLFSPNMLNQQHARKNHCFFLVFQK